jgi:hypothetical protein
VVIWESTLGGVRRYATTTKRSLVIALAGAALSSGCPASSTDMDASPDNVCWAANHLRAGHQPCGDGGVGALSIDFTLCRMGEAATTTDTHPDDVAVPSNAALRLEDERCGFELLVSPECVGATRRVSLTVEIARLTTGTLVAGANPYAEVFSSATHLAPESGMATETAPGRYRIDGIQFDQPGDWTVTLHLFGECPDIPRSPHTHASFTVEVP